MKKGMAILLSIVIFLFSFVYAFAEGEKIETPFERGTLGSDCYRIPGLLTLRDGTVMASADMRHNHGLDSPNNLDTVIATSENGLNGWKQKIVNYFDDYPDGTDSEDSASFIDPAIIQSKETGRIFLMTDVFPSGGGTWTLKTGTGMIEVQGKKYLALTDGENTDDISKFSYYIADFRDGFAPVLTRNESKPTGFSVDEEYHLYKDGKALEMKQAQTDKTILQNVFYQGAELSLYRTMHIQMRYSDDNGKSWSAPTILTPSIKSEEEGFLGLGPGRGFVTEYKGRERILFCVYDNAGGKENVSTIYSDDNGATWQRGEETKVRPMLKKTSEAQIVELPDGTLRMFTRTTISFIAYADSKDGGVSWSKFRADSGLSCTLNCMVSFINFDRQIDGKNVIIASFGSDIDERADGVVKIGFIDKKNRIEWSEPYHVNSGFYAYSCLTELPNGNIALLYEDEPYHINYTVLSVSEQGVLDEINGNAIDYHKEEKFSKKIARFFRDFGAILAMLIGIL